MPTLGLAWYESLTCERAIADPHRAPDTAKPAWPSPPAPLHYLKPIADKPAPHTDFAEPPATPTSPARRHRV